MPVALAGLDQATLARLLSLNNDHAVETSFLTADRFAAMIARAFAATTIAPASSLLIAFDQHADYDSDNFLWFRARYARFVYVDRVIVAASARGGGLARVLYEDLFARARAAGHDRVVCEVNSDPPNPGSDAFHARLGFIEVGNALIGNGKTVRYLSHSL
jgi:hypothetical protein